MALENLVACVEPTQSFTRFALMLLADRGSDGNVNLGVTK
jgi:hypothetical protein